MFPKDTTNRSLPASGVCTNIVAVAGQLLAVGEVGRSALTHGLRVQPATLPAGGVLDLGRRLVGQTCGAASQSFVKRF
ncbi:unnamed protein product [Gadus morhua 'NCC']